jgi:O-antigen/teichoic acid export membrane protein
MTTDTTEPTEAEEPASEQRPLRDLVRHTVIYGSGFVAGAAAGLILIPLYTHSMKPSEYGLYALMFVLYGVLKPVYDLGFTNSVARFFFDAESGEETETGLWRMSATGLAFLAVWGFALTALLWIFSDQVANLLARSSHHGNLVRIVGVMLYADTLAIVPLTLIRMQERSTRFLFLTISKIVLTLISSVIFVGFMNLKAEGALLGNAVPAIGCLVLLLPEYRRVLAGTPSRALLRQMLAFGLPFVPVLVSGWLIDASDRYLLELFRTRKEVGLYSLGYRFGQVMQIGVAAFGLGWAPLRYKIYTQPNAPQVYRRLTTFYWAAACFVGVGLSEFAIAIVAIVSPPSYAGAADVVPLIVLAYALQGLYFLTMTGMGVTKQTRPLAWISAVGAAANFGLNLVIIPALGMNGAALTTVFAYMIMVGGSWYYSEKVYHVPYDWSRITLTSLLSGLAVGIVYVIHPNGVLEDVVLGTVVWAAWGIAMLKTGVIEADDLRGARQWLRDIRVRLQGTPPDPEVEAALESEVAI